jgi:hypothetical protein
LILSPHTGAYAHDHRAGWSANLSWPSYRRPLPWSQALSSRASSCKFRLTPYTTPR